MTASAGYAQTFNADGVATPDRMLAAATGTTGCGPGFETAHHFNAVTSHADLNQTLRDL